MKFALFFLGEYTHMITTSFLIVVLFFGGWHFPVRDRAGRRRRRRHDPQAGRLRGKMVLFILFYMLIRWTIPRFRFDQLMGLAWKVLIPLALVNLVVVMVVKHYRAGSPWLLLPVSLVLLVLARHVAAAAATSGAMPTVHT